LLLRSFAVYINLDDGEKRMQPPAARPGIDLKVLQRKVDYSFWPMGRTTRRYGLQSRVFATDPWAVIRHSIDQRCPAVAKQQAQAFRAQAQDYFKAADVTSLFTTRPLLLYYSFLNLAKAFTLTQSARPEYAAAYHGLKEKIQPANGRELFDSVLEAVPSGANVNIFDDFLTAIRGSGLGGNVTYRIPVILPQLLQGHRLWCSAAHQDERFIEVARIDLMQDSPSKSLWIVLNIFEDDLTRLGLTHNNLIRSAGIHGRFREVVSSE
jgi:hypothetical protein